MKEIFDFEVITSKNWNPVILLKYLWDSYYGIDSIIKRLSFSWGVEEFKSLSKIRELIQKNYISPFKEEALKLLEIEKTYKILPHNFFVIREFFWEELANKVCNLYNNKNKEIVEKFISDNKLKKYNWDWEAVFLDSPSNTEAIVIVDDYKLCAITAHRWECKLINLHRHI